MQLCEECSADKRYCGHEWSKIKTQRDYYIRATSDGHKMSTLAQTDQRANVLMCEDIYRLDPFQRSQQQHDWANMPD